LKGEEARDASKSYLAAVAKREASQKDKATTVAEKANLGKIFTARIDNYVEKEDGGGKNYVAYNVVCSWEGLLDEQKHSWSMEVRYSTFLSLHEMLVEVYPFESGELPPFPGKQMFGGSDLASTRQKDLNRWLGGLVSNAVFLLSKEVNTFLNLKSQIRWAKNVALQRVKAKRRALQDSEAAMEEREVGVNKTMEQTKKEAAAAAKCADPLSFLLDL
jgi:hypothetical protein